MARKKPGKKPTKSSDKRLSRPRLRITSGYAELLKDLKSRVRAAQIKATFAVNRELITLYWDIGRMIVERQEREGWGNSVIERLVGDVQRAFPGLSGFSRTNIFRMRAFFRAYAPPAAKVPQAVGQFRGTKISRREQQSPAKIVPQPVGLSEITTPPAPLTEIPWGHNVLLIEKLSDNAERVWYANKTIEHGWSRAVLTLQIETNLIERQGNAVTNFASRLPAPQSDLAQQSLKDPYLFDFLTLREDAIERDLELSLIDHIQKFLVELGAGFAFVGRQVPIAVGDSDFSLDLLFYHLKLRGSLPTIEEIELELRGSECDGSVVEKTPLTS